MNRPGEVTLNLIKKKSMFKEIEISDNKFRDYSNDKIADLSKVNLFVGQNNSGKSKLLRELFYFDKLNFSPNNLDLTEINKVTDQFYLKLKRFFHEREIFSFGKVITNIDGYKPLMFINSDFSPQIEIINKLLAVGNANIGGAIATNKDRYRNEIGLNLKRGIEESLPKLEKLIPNDYSYKYDILYFPTLRGLRPLVKNDKADHYKRRTISDYFSDEQEKFYETIYTGLTFYEDLTKLLLGRHKEKQKVYDFQSFLSNTFFKGEGVDLIPNIDDDVVYIKIGDEQDYPIYKLGDGIQMIIILMYPLFFKSSLKLKVFLEEPELYLHPGMQRILLDSLSDPDLFPEHQFFISTHSNHFLDMTADFENISIYSVQKNIESKKFDISNVENSNSDVLNILGVKNSSVFLSNCTIWVEGITDRIYLRKFLEVYFMSLSETNIKEDIHFSFVEYGGGNITHWSFLEDADPDYPNINVERLCGKLFLISDKDGAGLKKNGEVDSRKKKKNERHQKLKAKLGNRYYCLESREIENLLVPHVLKKTIQKFEKSNFESVTFNNWNIDSYKNKPIGKFIDENAISLARTYSVDSGTINEKVKFAKRAIETIESVEDLSAETISICEKLYIFIKEQNASSL